MAGLNHRQVSSTSTTSSPKSLHHLMKKVFSNDLLVEHILSRAIQFKKGHTASCHVNPDIANFRLVSKSWLNAVASIYRHAQQPLFHLQLTQENTSGLLAILNNEKSKDVKVKDSILRQFTSYMAHWGWDEPGPNFPLFHLELTPSFFKIADANIYEAVFSFFQEYASDSMVRFTFNFHRSKFDHIPSSVPDFNFANLRYIHILIERMAWSFIPLIQKLLISAPNLEILDFTSSSCLVTYNANHLAEAVDAIASRRPYILGLPDETKKVLLYGTADSCSCFYKIPFDNLKKLDTLALSASSCIQRQLDEIFSALSNQLVHLHLIGFKSCTYSYGAVFEITLPRLPHLQTLTVTMPWETNNSHWFSYETHLPSLKELTLVHHDDQILESFLTKQQVFSVQKITIISAEQHNFTENGVNRSSIRLGMSKLSIAQSVRCTFPNLTHLGLAITNQCMTTLEYVINKMKCLKSLALYVEANERFSQGFNFDSFFTGLNYLACEAMVDNDNPGYWATINLEDEEKFPSIRILRNLEALYLIEVTYPPCPGFLERPAPARSPDIIHGVSTGHSLCNFAQENLPNSRKYLFSELSFYFSFMRMKKLKTLGFTTGFMPPKPVQDKWEKKKGAQILHIKAPKLQHIMTAKFSLTDDTWYYDS